MLSSADFEAVFRNDHTIMLLVDPDAARIVDANPGAERFYGWSVEELRGRALSDIVTLPADELATALADSRDGRRRHFAVRHRRADRSVRDVHVSSGPVRVRGRNLLCAVVHDAADLVDAREALRLRDEALDASDSALVLADADGRIVWCNRAFTALTGYHIDEAVGHTPGALVGSGVQGPEFYRDLWRTVRSGRTWRGELVNRRKDGSHYHEDMTITPILDEGGTLTHYIAVKHDASERIAREAELRRWAAVFHHAGAGIAASDRSGQHIALLNEAFASMHGTTVEELVGRPVRDLFDAGEAGAVDAAIREAEASGHVVVEGVRRRRDGSTFPASIDLAVVPEGEGLDVKLIGTMHDLTRLRETEALLLDQQQRAELAARTANIGFWTILLPERSAVLSDEWKRQKGFAPEELEDGIAAWESLLHPEDRDEARRRLEAYLDAPTGPYHSEYRMRHQDGSYRRILSQGVPQRTQDGRVVAVHGLHMDVTDVSELRQQVETLTYGDPLTGLPNREGLLELIGTMLAGAGRRKVHTAVAFAGIDGFRAVNDSLGHAVGDAVLVRIAHELSGAIREGDILGRFGGDTFVVVASDLDHAEDADTLANHLQRALAARLDVAGHELTLSCSVGVAVAPGDGDSAQELLSHAEAALHAAKTDGAATVRFFAPSLQEEALGRLRLRNALGAALAHDEIVAAFQPQVDLATGAWTGMEALARWTHDEWGAVSPGRFIPEAERSGSIQDVGRAVRRASLARMRACIDAGLPCPRVSVNVSARELVDPSLVEDVMRDLEDSGVPGSRLEIEVTESAVMTGERTLEALAKLRAAGMRVAIDDFGTGYASLAYLRHLPADVLKIDKSFVAGLGTSSSRADESLVRGVIELAAAFDMEVVAEGVETDEERRFLLDAGCRVGQGYLLARPMAPEALMAWARTHGEEQG